MLPDKETETFSLTIENDSQTDDEELMLTSKDKVTPEEKEKHALESKRNAYRIDLRRYVDRRQEVDRREAVRFEDDRRQYIRRAEDRRWRLS